MAILRIEHKGNTEYHTVYPHILANVFEGDLLAYIDDILEDGAVWEILSCPRLDNPENLWA